MKATLTAAAIFLLSGAPAVAHRLDEYLQGTIISVEKNRVDAQITLTPGVAVFSALIRGIDLNADGVISEAEQHAYAGRVLRDITIAIDGHALTPRLRSMEFGPVEEMKAGQGEIRIEFDADLPSGGLNRKLTFENHHLSGIAAYQVNCLVPRDPDIRILAQNRNFTQSLYELDFENVSSQSNSSSVLWTSSVGEPLGIFGFFLFTWLASRWMRQS